MVLVRFWDGGDGFSGGGSSLNPSTMSRLTVHPMRGNTAMIIIIIFIYLL